jgi:hypothetical protein
MEYLVELVMIKDKDSSFASLLYFPCNEKEAQMLVNFQKFQTSAGLIQLVNGAECREELKILLREHTNKYCYLVRVYKRDRSLEK